VNSRRLMVVLLIFSAGLMAVTWVASNSKKARQEQDGSQATQPVEQITAGGAATTAPASRPSATAARRGGAAAVTAATAAASRPAPASRPAKPAQANPAPASAPADTPVKTISLYARLAEPRSIVLGSLGPKSEYVFQLALDSRGAAVRSLKLADYFATVADKRRYQKDAATYRQALKEHPDKYKGFYRLLNPVGRDPATQHLSLATGRLRISIEGESTPVEPVDLDRLNWQLLPTTSPATAPAAEIASFQVTLATDPRLAEPLLRIVKTYKVNARDYSIEVSLSFENLSGKVVTVTVDQLGPTGLPREGLRADMRRAAYGSLQSSDKQRRVQVRLKNITDATAKMRLGEAKLIGDSDGTDPIVWLGFVNKFFGSMMYLKPVIAERLAAPSYRAKFLVRAVAEADGQRTYVPDVRINQLSVRPGKLAYVRFDVFAGPKKRDILSNGNNRYHKPLYSKLNYIGTIEFGRCCTFSWLALAMMWLLDFFSATIAFGNYGVAIILLVLLVRLVLHPLTKRGQISMMGMQKLGPAMQKLKEKYGDDKNALNKEMMKLYKEQGASPLLGCLPMFLQTPIWIALYTGLSAAVELRHAAFLPVWITDLSVPDALFAFPHTIPWIGPTFNFLPLLLAVAMYLQQKYSPTTPQATTGSDQAQQTQKMMKYMLPGMMVVFFYKAPSGLTLYIMASTFAGILDQYFVRKHIRDKQAAEAAIQTTVSVPGKAARSSRPKKPKGPFWVKRG